MKTYADNDSALACLLLVERIAEKYGAPIKERRKQPAAPLTEAEVAKLRSDGVITRIAAPRALSVLGRKTSGANMGRPRGAGLDEAMRDAMAAVRQHKGRPPQGTFKEIAARHGVIYGSLMTRVDAARRIEGLQRRAA